MMQTQILTVAIKSHLTFSRHFFSRRFKWPDISMTAGTYWYLSDFEIQGLQDYTYTYVFLEMWILNFEI